MFKALILVFAIIAAAFAAEAPVRQERAAVYSTYSAPLAYSAYNTYPTAYSAYNTYPTAYSAYSVPTLYNNGYYNAVPAVRYL